MYAVVFFGELGFAVHLRVQIALFSKKLQPIEIRSQSTGMAGISHRQKSHVKRDKKERERHLSRLGCAHLSTSTDRTLLLPCFKAMNAALQVSAYFPSQQLHNRSPVIPSRKTQCITTLHEQVVFSLWHILLKHAFWFLTLSVLIYLWWLDLQFSPGSKNKQTQQK